MLVTPATASTARAGDAVIVRQASARGVMSDQRSRRGGGGRPRRASPAKTPSGTAK